MKKAAGLDKGAAGAGGSGGSGKSVSLKHVFEIARIKCRDENLGVLGEERVAKGIIGSARSLGLEVVP